MDLSVEVGNALETAVPLVALGLWEDAELPASLADLIEPDDFKARSGQKLLLYPRGALPMRRLLLLGLGKQSGATADTLRRFAALAAQQARDLQQDTLLIAMPSGDNDPATAAQTLTEGALMGLYRFQNYKSDLPADQRHDLASLRLLVAADADAARAGQSRGAAIAHGVAFARDLANTPGNDLYPARLADLACELGRRFDFPVTVLDEAELHAQGFGGILAVGQGSACPPRFVIMEYGRPAGADTTICLVGKGITFDTGGISIKPADRMADMKMDMGGAAAVLGTMHALAELQLPLHVVGLISTAENMPGANAYRPGDIIKTLSGKTVEVLNTDAEGRIVLADALHYAARYQPRAVVDLATLTGAISVALGPHAIGLMANNQELADRLLRLGTAQHERVWQLPLWDEYCDMMKSDIADLKNTGGRAGGAITAAGFLAAFADAYPWAHLDIAGTAWTDTNNRPYLPKGATGVGVRLLIALLQSYLDK
jgi:leucyl aminopeptidase